MIIKHLRRHVPGPEGPRRVIRCECGWEGGADRNLDPKKIEARLEQLYRQHLPEAEARTHLLVDSREDSGRDGEPAIKGVWIMPVGEPVALIASRFDQGIHHGTYRTPDGRTGELPIGEVTTPTGRVFRLDE